MMGTSLPVSPFDFRNRLGLRLDFFTITSDDYSCNERKEAIVTTQPGGLREWIFIRHGMKKLVIEITSLSYW